MCDDGDTCTKNECKNNVCVSTQLQDGDPGWWDITKAGARVLWKIGECAVSVGRSKVTRLLRCVKKGYEELKKIIDAISAFKNRITSALQGPVEMPVIARLHADVDLLSKTASALCVSVIDCLKDLTPYGIFKV